MYEIFNGGADMVSGIQITSGVEEALIESVDDDLEAFRKLGFEDIKWKSDLKASADKVKT